MRFEHITLIVAGALATVLPAGLAGPANAGRSPPATASGTSPAPTRTSREGRGTSIAAQHALARCPYEGKNAAPAVSLSRIIFSHPSRVVRNAAAQKFSI